jgi:hypothetical protein
MAFEHFTDRERCRFRAVFHGLVTKSDLVEHIAQRRAEQVLGFDALIDYSDAVLQVDYADSIALRDFVRRMMDEGSSVGRTALVSPNPVNFGSNRMLSTGAEELYPIRAFRTVEEATAWLGWDE